MTAEEAREIFNGIIANETRPEWIAKLEFVREFFCNVEFRKFVNKSVFELTWWQNRETVEHVAGRIVESVTVREPPEFPYGEFPNGAQFRGECE